MTEPGSARRAEALAARVTAALEEAFERPESPRVVEDAGAAARELAAFVGEGRDRWRALVSRAPVAPVPAAHAFGVALHATALARQLDLSPAFIAALAVGAALHDLGRTLLPPELVAARPDRGTDAWHVVAQHPRLGVDLVAAGRPVNEATRDAILGHHERLDGSGYPFGLSGDDVPLAARLVAIADCHDHLARRAPLDPAAALAALRDEAARGLDPDLVAEHAALSSHSDDAW